MKKSLTIAALFLTGAVFANAATTNSSSEFTKVEFKSFDDSGNFKLEMTLPPDVITTKTSIQLSSGEYLDRTGAFELAFPGGYVAVCAFTNNNDFKEYRTDDFLPETLNGQSVKLTFELTNFNQDTGEYSLQVSYSVGESNSGSKSFDKVSFGGEKVSWNYLHLGGVSGVSGASSVETKFSAIPEPSAFGLLAGIGALALVASRRRRVKKD